MPAEFFQLLLNTSSEVTDRHVLHQMRWVFVETHGTLRKPCAERHTFLYPRDNRQNSRKSNRCRRQFVVEWSLLWRHIWRVMNSIFFPAERFSPSAVSLSRQTFKRFLRMSFVSQVGLSKFKTHTHTHLHWLSCWKVSSNQLVKKFYTALSIWLGSARSTCNWFLSSVGYVLSANLGRRLKGFLEWAMYRR